MRRRVNGARNSLVAAPRATGLLLLVLLLPLGTGKALVHLADEPRIDEKSRRETPSSICRWRATICERGEEGKSNKSGAGEEKKERYVRRPVCDFPTGFRTGSAFLCPLSLNRSFVTFLSLLDEFRKSRMATRRRSVLQSGRSGSVASVGGSPDSNPSPTGVAATTSAEAVRSVLENVFMLSLHPTLSSFLRRCSSSL